MIPCFVDDMWQLHACGSRRYALRCEFMEKFIGEFYGAIFRERELLCHPYMSRAQITYTHIADSYRHSTEQKQSLHADHELGFHPKLAKAKQITR